MTIASTNETAQRWRLRARTKLVAIPGPPGNGTHDKVMLRLGDRQGKIDPFDEIAETLLSALAEGGVADVILDRVATVCGEASREQAGVLFERLRAAGFCEQVVEAPADLASADMARFSRLLDFFSEFEDAKVSRYDFLTRLRSSRVAVIGTGGMGSWLIYHLACCGVGRLRLIDGDVVEPSNLNRSILYNEGDIGSPKVLAAARSVSRFAPRTEVDTHEVYISGTDDLRRLLDGVDLIVCCADRPTTWLLRRWVAEAALATGVPALCASGLRIGPLYRPGESSCLMCDWTTLVDQNPALPAMLQAQQRLPQGTSGSVSPIGAVTASLLGWEVLRQLSGYTEPKSLNGIWELDSNLSAGLKALPRNPRCPVCAAGVSVSGDDIEAG